MSEVVFSLQLAMDVNSGKVPGSIVTRDGKPVRILCWDAKGDYPVIGLIDLKQIEVPGRFTVGGKHDIRDNVKTDYDLHIVMKGGES